jgi:3-hydroxy-9,10-secoandrosta-1,3,5(10)-triene-9,17-dione monooxygenase reductase component
MNQSPAFDAAQYRQVLGHFPTGVTVVTTVHDGQPVGLAIGSFTSVSLDPPLVGFFPGKSSSSFPAIEASGSFCVNVLAADQEHLSRVFASKAEDKFQGLGWKPGVTGSPVLDGVLAWIDCDVESITEAGDHWFVLGRVRNLDAGGSGGPLVFYRGGYGHFEV